MKILRIVILCWMLTFTYSVGSAQILAEGELKFFRIPSELAFTMISTRDNAPVVLNSVSLYATSDGRRVVCRCQIRNIGGKAIRNVEMDIITNFMFHVKGGGRLERYVDELEFDGSKGFPVLLPEGVAWSREYLSKTADPLPNEFIVNIRQQSSEIKAKFIVGVVVSRVDFSDGTTYDAKSNADDLWNIFAHSDIR